MPCRRQNPHRARAKPTIKLYEPTITPNLGRRLTGGGNGLSNANGFHFYKESCVVGRSTGLAIVSCTAFVLSACSSAPPGSSPPLPPASRSASATRVRPDFNDSAYVKIHFHNGWGVRVTARTEWSYFIFPAYFLAEEQCVLPNQDWASEIGFQYPNGEVAITADRDNCTGHKDTHERALVFSSIEYTHANPERATITSDVRDDKRYGFSLCGRQTYPIMGEIRCDHR